MISSPYPPPLSLSPCRMTRRQRSTPLTASTAQIAISQSRTPTAPSPSPPLQRSFCLNGPLAGPIVTFRECSRRSSARVKSLQLSPQTDSSPSAHSAHVNDDSSTNHSSSHPLSSTASNSYAQATFALFVDLWIPAITTKHDSLLANKTGHLVPCSPEMNILPCMYIFCLKSSGRKTQFVALGSK